MDSAALTVLKGIGPKTAEEMKNHGIRTVEELLRLFPVRYDRPPAVLPIAETENDIPVAVRAKLLNELTNRGFGQKTITSGRIGDESGKLNVSFFHMPYLRQSLHKGDERVFRGVIRESRYGRSMDHPKLYEEAEYETLSKGIWPVYSCGDVSRSKLQSAVKQALERMGEPEEILPPALLAQGYLSEKEALRNIHFPENEELLRKARERLVFEEFLAFVLRIRLLKEKEYGQANPCPMPEHRYTEQLLSSLPFALTGAQKRVAEEIFADLSGAFRMHRLVQGDVGSGKTILALLALVKAWENGYQGALMAPTEVLARQHYNKITTVLAQAGIPCRVVLLTGSVKSGERRAALEQIENGKAGLIIGTHALIQEKVVFSRLGLVVTDEQHRFGVRQREELAFKGCEPHTLVMSATPIPRTLAIILYGDLDISVVDELPAGRTAIQSCVVSPAARNSSYRFIQKELDAGRQAYIICPLVEESEEGTGENVLDYTAMLKELFPPDIRIDYLHGRMKPAEKNAKMEAFLNGDIQLLVSTTVVEVGVDVPNATVMMIENAERFGLAQLHQLRGRVGRGKYPSYAIFVNGSGKKEKNPRLEVMVRSQDGFEIASEDLKLRGPGDVFGIRQSGEMSFELGDVFDDHALLLKAGETAAELLREDPTLSRPEHQALKRYAMSRASVD